MSFRAFVVDLQDDNFSAGVQSLEETDLPQGDVTITVQWSSVNYKDGLATLPKGRVVTSYPMVPGIDLAGTVRESNDAHFQAGQPVLVTGYDLGIGHFGGFAELARVPGDWIVPLPDGLSLEETMALGTAGFTAGLSVQALQHGGVTPDSGPVLVTGATGGVGSTAVAMLAQLGYTVAASTGKADEHDYLRALGASEILTREEVSEENKRPIEKERWAGAVDPVGGTTTAYILRTLKRDGVSALSGLTGGAGLSTTVMPFILRGASLAGIESVYCPMDLRTQIWRHLGSDWKPNALLDSIAVHTDLDGVAAAAASILQGGVRGRTLVQIN
ncbi:MAG: NADPH:quinone reductase [Chloroflexi bacterium]|nr:MAG: NADPH:quinone reductase [Chloroflexota bacterium]